MVKFVALSYYGDRPVVKGICEFKCSLIILYNTSQSLGDEFFA
jgi:hypothetical protein